MARGHRSARGEIVDFDLLRIKENLGAAPKPSTVKAREDFIDQKHKRRIRRMTETVAVLSRPSAPVVPTPEVVVAPTPTEEYDETAPEVLETAEPVAPASTTTKKRVIKTSE